MFTLLEWAFSYCINSGSAVIPLRCVINHERQGDRKDGQGDWKDANLWMSHLEGGSVLVIREEMSEIEE